MTTAPTDMPLAIRQRAIELGAVRCGFAAAMPVDQAAVDAYQRWLHDGANGSMLYCANYDLVRRDPRLLLDGAATVISCAFPYRQAVEHPMIAQYALGADYHYVVRQRLEALGAFITGNYGGQVRPLVDTAPMRERYWAVRAGVGFIGVNNQLIVPGVGSYVFLGELLWTGSIVPDEPCRDSCAACMACVRACPGRALDGSGRCDARRCVSYLTIEHRGDLPPEAHLGRSIYGCDICQMVCPHNAVPSPRPLPEFAPSPELLALDAEALRATTPSHYKRLTAHSAMRRAPLRQLLRNLDHRDPDENLSD